MCRSAPAKTISKFVPTYIKDDRCGGWSLHCCKEFPVRRHEIIGNLQLKLCELYNLLLSINSRKKLLWNLHGQRHLPLGRSRSVSALLHCHPPPPTLIHPVQSHYSCPSSSQSTKSFILLYYSPLPSCALPQPGYIPKIPSSDHPQLQQMQIAWQREFKLSRGHSTTPSTATPALYNDKYSQSQSGRVSAGLLNSNPNTDTREETYKGQLSETEEQLAKKIR